MLLFVQIVDIVEVRHVAMNDLLRSLNLRGNPLRELPDYRLSVVFAVQQLTELDTEHVDVAEKVCFICQLSVLVLLNELINLML